MFSVFAFISSFLWVDCKTNSDDDYNGGQVDQDVVANVVIGHGRLLMQNNHQNEHAQPHGDNHLYDRVPEAGAHLPIRKNRRAFRAFDANVVAVFADFHAILIPQAVLFEPVPVAGGNFIQAV